MPLFVFALNQALYSMRYKHDVRKINPCQPHLHLFLGIEGHFYNESPDRLKWFPVDWLQRYYWSHLEDRQSSNSHLFPKL